MAEINPLTTRKMFTPDEYNVKSSLNNETQQSANLQQYIRNELDKALPMIFANLSINTTKVVSSDEIYRISKSEQATCLQVSKANLEHELEQYSISEDLRKQIFSYLETQIFNRFRAWNTSSILAADRNKLTVMIRNRESELQEYLHEISAQTNSSDRTSVIEIFENIWNDHISPMKKLFNTETEWTQIIQLIFEVYQGFNNDTKSSFDDIISYLPFLISQTPMETQISLNKILNQIRNECVSKMLDENPVVWRSNYYGYKTFDPKVLTHFHYIDGEKLNDIWLEMNSDSSIENNYQQFCQKIFREWSLFIPVAFYFECLTQRINKIFILRQPLFEVILIQEVIHIVDTLIKDINLQLIVFQLRISEILHHTLHTCAVIFISSFYYNQQRTYFNQIIRSVEQNQQKLKDYFLCMIFPSEYNDKNMAVNFTTDFCNTLLQSFNQQTEQIIELSIEKQQSIFNRQYFMNQLDQEVFNASEDWLMRYILQPMNILNEQIDQQWYRIKMDIEQQCRENKTFHFQLFTEFFTNITAFNSARSTSLLNDLFKSSNDNMNETLKNRQTCIVTLLYEYLSGEFNTTNINTADDFTYQMIQNWQKITQQLPKPSNEFKKIFRSMKKHFEIYSIYNLIHFLDQISRNRDEVNKQLTESIHDSIDKTIQTTQKRLQIQARGCTAQCPCCRRLCDFDHGSSKAFAIGQGDNRHCCQFGHQIQGLGGVRNALTNEVSIICCEKLKDADEIIYGKDNIQQNWMDIKSTHFDWDLTETSESQEKISAHIWSKIGQQLWQYYETERGCFSDKNELESNHFILFYGYSIRSYSESPSILQRMQRYLFSSQRSGTRKSNQIGSDLQSHMPDIINDFVRIRDEKCTNDRITFITDSSSNITINRAVKLSEMNDQIIQYFSNHHEPSNFSVLLKRTHQQLAEIENDPKLNILRHTIIFIISGDLDTFPFNELIDLEKTYHSIIKHVWTIVLGEVTKNITQLNEIMHGTIRVVDHRKDLHGVYLEIMSMCNTQSSISFTDELIDNSVSPINEASLSVEMPTQRETSIAEPISSNNTTFQCVTTTEQKQYSDSIMIPSTPESLIYDQILHVTLPFQQTNVFPDVLSTIIEQVVPISDENMTNDILIPLPSLSKRSIDYLPTIEIKLGIKRDGFLLKEFLKCFVQDIGVNENDVFIIEAEEGSIRMKLTFSTKVASDEAKLQTIKDITVTMNLPATNNFLAMEIQKQRVRPNHSISQMNDIVSALENFDQIGLDRLRLTPETIDHSLHMSHLTTILDRSQSQFLKNKSQQIADCLMHAFRGCAFDYTLEHALLVYNKVLVDQYRERYGRPRNQDNEKVLFHGTTKENFDGIFHNNFQYNANVKRTDSGWYGKGIYFSSSPRKALSYARSWKHDSIVYIICSIVAVGKSLTITNMDYRGKPMHSDYDSHYVRTSCQHGEPISPEEEPFYEEFVIKNSNRILPLFIVGILRTYQCAIWRDLRINNEANNSILYDIRRRSPFQVYESKTSEDSLNILQYKFADHEMRCAVITNGADDGQQFVVECRKLRPNIPVVVYCKNKAYHQQWALALGEPEIKVTGNGDEVFQFVNHELTND